MKVRKFIMFGFMVNPQEFDMCVRLYNGKNYMCSQRTRKPFLVLDYFADNKIPNNIKTLNKFFPCHSFLSDSPRYKKKYSLTIKVTANEVTASKNQ